MFDILNLHNSDPCSESACIAMRSTDLCIGIAALYKIHLLDIASQHSLGTPCPYHIFNIENLPIINKLNTLQVMAWQHYCYTNNENNLIFSSHPVS